jgi:translocation and assembly module TamA
LDRLGLVVVASAVGVLVASAVAVAPADCAPTKFGHAEVARAEVRGVDDKALRLQIQEAIGQTAVPAASRLEARRRANEAADKATAVLRSEGYYGAVVEPDIGEGDAPTVFVSVTPGTRFVLADPTIEWVGAPPGPDAAALARTAMALKSGQPGRAAAVIAAEGRIVANLQKHGYADAMAGARQVVVDYAAATVTPTYRIDGGELVHMAGIDRRGHSRTQAAWLNRLAPWKPGDVYRPEDVAELERRLLDTGVFEAVTVSLAPASDAKAGRRPVIVSLADRPRGRLELGASYSTTEGAGVDSRWLVFNRLGLGDTITTTLQFAEIDSRLQTELALPNWGRPNEILKLTTAIYRDNTPAYDERAIGISGDITHRYGATSFLAYGVSAEASDTIEKQTANFVTPSRHRRLETFASLLSFTWDRSNDPLNPTSGWKVTARADPTANFGDGPVDYLKLSSQASAYLPIGNADTVIAARVKLGSILGGNIPLVPAPQRFYAGGGGSVRGYAYQAVGPRYADNTPEGGLSLFESSLELRRKVVGDWGAVAFVDAGAVGDRVNPDFRHPDIGVGVGVRYNLGFGPIRLDIATPLQRRTGDASVQVYLSLGQSF